MSDAGSGADCSELQGLLPRLLEALHAKKVWEDLQSVDEIQCSKFQDLGKPHIGKLTSLKSTDSESSKIPLVVKFESKIPTGLKHFKIEPRTVEISQLLSDAGLAPKLLAFSLSETGPNFTVEPLGVCCFDLAAAIAADKAGEDYWLTANSAASTGGIMARLAARLHTKIDPKWYDKYRSEIIELCPLMKDEEASSPLWVMMRTDALGQARLAAAKNGRTEGDSETDIFLNQKRPNAPSTKDMKRLVGLLPKPVGQHASRVVTVHGDLWSANVISHLSEKDENLLIDLEGVTVACAATDLAQFCNERGVSKVYLEELSSLEAGEASVKEEDVDKFWFEMLVAGVVQTGILRRMCWEDADLEVDSVQKTIAFAEKFKAYVEKLRKEWALALQILESYSSDAPPYPGSDNKPDKNMQEEWISDETMDAVLGNSWKPPAK